MVGYIELIIARHGYHEEFSIKFSLDADNAVYHLEEYIGEGVIPKDPFSINIINEFTKRFGDRNLYRVTGRFHETIWCFDKDPDAYVDEIDEWLN